MSTEDYEKMNAVETNKEAWINSKWRPMMGWTYMIICLFDFVIAPVLWSILQSSNQGHVQLQWQPLTLQGGGLFHIAMGAVLGISAYGRTQEKLNGASNFGTTYIAPAVTATSAPSIQVATTLPPMQPIIGYGGKPAPLQPEDPIR